jgi:hypothetical protein
MIPHLHQFMLCLCCLNCFAAGLIHARWWLSLPYVASWCLVAVALYRGKPK